MNSWIHPNITVKKTKDNGLGTFATSLIAAGESIIIQKGKIIDFQSMENSDYKQFDEHCFQIDKETFICPIEPNWEKLDGVFLCNHSCDPSCGFTGQTTLVAMRDIQNGEEITYDYAMTDGNWGEVTHINMVCICRARRCRGIMKGTDWKLKNLQKQYRGYFSQFIQTLIDQER